MAFKRRCELETCKKEYEVKYFLSHGKYCSPKCRLTAWALREANKAMEGGKK